MEYILITIAVLLVWSMVFNAIIAGETMDRFLIMLFFSGPIMSFMMFMEWANNTRFPLWHNIRFYFQDLPKVLREYDAERLKIVLGRMQEAKEKSPNWSTRFTCKITIPKIEKRIKDYETN